MEDIMEQLIGDIEDEHDIEDSIEEEIEPGFYRFSARLDVEDLNEKFELELPTMEAYETLGGLMLHHAEEIPEQGFTLELDGCILIVEEVSSSKIQTILVRTVNNTST